MGIRMEGMMIAARLLGFRCSCCCWDAPPREEVVVEEGGVCCCCEDGAWVIVIVACCVTFWGWRVLSVRCIHACVGDVYV